jgi:hypothetical protein
LTHLPHAASDIDSFISIIDDILDTPAKQTLWLDMIPLLDLDDQDYCKRQIAQAVTDSINDRTNETEHDRDDFVLSDQEIDDLFDLTYQIDDGNFNFKKMIKNIKND